MRILVDLDGVCCDFYSRWLEFYNRDFDDTLTIDDITTWGVHHFRKANKKMYEYFNQPGFWRNLIPIEGCKDVLYHLKDKGHDVLIVTSVPLRSERALYEKTEWVEEHLPFIGYKSVISAHRKDVVEGNLLFDDGPHNLRAFEQRARKKQSRRMFACAMDWPYNRHFSSQFRVSNWPAFENLVSNICERYPELRS